MPKRLSQSSTEPASPSRPTGSQLVLIGVAATSAAGLIFEITLTRVFAIAQFYHFAFLSVSLALLGLGASGSALSVLPRLGRGGPRRWTWLAAGQSFSIIAAYWLTNSIPFDSFAIAWDPRQVLYLTVYYVALAVPFFFGGLVVAVLLAGIDSPLPSHHVYGAGLVGSGGGAIAALLCLGWWGGETTIGLAAAVAMAGGIAFGFVRSGRFWSKAGLVAATIGCLVLAATVPGPFELNLSPYKDLSSALRFPDSEITTTVWDRGTRIDLVESEGIRSLPGLSLTYSGAPPLQDGITFDGDDLSPIPRGESAEFVPYLLSSLAYRLRPEAASLILAPRGGFELAVALAGGAGSIVAVEPHAAAVRAIRESGPSSYDDLRVVTVDDDPRVFAERTQSRFDIVDLALTAPYRPVTSGAYSLAENYLLTVEAFRQYVEVLSPGGVLTAMRWMQTPPSEETRLLAVAIEALRSTGVDPEASVVMLRSYSNALLVVCPDGFSRADLNVVEQFAQTERFDVIIAPDLNPTNQFNVVPDEQYSQLAADLLSAEDPDTVYRSHHFEIKPPTDDRPFFGHFFRWSQASTVFKTLGRTWQPFGGAGIFVLVALLVISTAAAVVLISAPLLVRRRKRPSGAGRQWWALSYFGLLGVAFLFVEIPIIQRYILLVGRPTIAFAVVLSALLVASGIGSVYSRRIPWRSGSLLLAALAVLYPHLIRWVTPQLLPAPESARVVAGALLLVPLGFLMGIMFPRGLEHLEQSAPRLVPWAWAVNGTVSVIAAAAAALLTLSFGFSVVLLIGAGAYGLAAILVWTGAATSPSPG